MQNPHSISQVTALAGRTPVLISALLLALLISCGSKQTMLPWLSPDATVLAFGDSLTHGTGAAKGESYPAVLADLTGRRIINAGVPGETTAQGLQRLPALLEQHQPDLLLLCLGGNDFLRRQSAEAAKQNLARMIEMAQAASVPVLLIGVPQPGLFLSADPIYAELAEQYQVILEADAIPSVLDDKALKSDTVHPNAAGYRQIAQAIADLMRSRGAL